MSQTTTTTSSTPLTNISTGSGSGSNNDRKKLQLKIDNYWYDLTVWQHTHPGGAKILEHMHGQDATDAFYSLHSKEAIERLSRLSRTEKTPNGCKEPTPTKVALAFRQFRAQLEKEGWFERNIFWEIFYMTSVYLTAILGTYLAYTGHPWYAMFIIGVCMQQAGWIGHDYVHGRGNFVFYAGRIMSGAINAFSPSWWSDKHNTHHVYTNYLGVDTDIQNDPIFHLFTPDEKNDVHFRKYQHFYFPIVGAFLYMSWRIQSFQYAAKHGLWTEVAAMTINWIWLYFLGFPIALGSILVGGFLVVIIVTATHQSEEKIEYDAANPFPYSFVECQFATTRDARTWDPITEWLWGGMQYQLEHHLLPTMPKYYYSSVAKRVEQFAKENGLSYRCDGMVEILKRNINTLKEFALSPAVPVKQN